ncbi:DUF4395 domain-containing protein [Pedobacter aquatilis]|uniref:DUF4395 domain-containing protein n=1 Tax=Pedobacter aquatilis TaxID=351343 RepID=UPI00292D2F99|nr:DUF4395 domain-containing protein [Pedobacter aquatilis]
MELSCPISAERVNENVVRVVALIVAAIAITCVFTENYWAILFLIFDFGLRAFTSGKWSILRSFSFKLNIAFNLPIKMTDLAPKKFAATMGFAFCLLITATFLFNFLTASLVLTSVMIVFALLESLMGICVGCYVYTLLSMLKGKG